MAARISGITIEIGGDTTKLQSALKGVNSRLKDTNSALKDVDKLLKLDPKNTELLQQKQKLLAEAINDTSDKLKTEKEALAQLKAGPQTEETIRQQEALTREIVETEQSLNKLNDQYKDFGSVAKQQAKAAADEIDKVGKKISDVGDKITKVGTGLTAGITAPVTAAATASVAAWTEVDEAMDIVVEKTGASGEALEDMQSRVSNIAKTIPTSFEAAGTAIGEVNTRFGVTGDKLEKLSTKFIEFAELNGTDVNNSIDTVQTTLNAFGLSADSAGAVLDILNKVGQDTGISMDTLASLMTSNATAFRSLGLNAADAANLLGTLEKSGIDTSVVMTGLSKVQKSAMEDGISMEQALTNALTSSENAIDIFGSKAGPKLYSAFQNGTLSAEMFTESTHNINEALGSVSDTYEATLDPLDQMTVALNTLKDTGAEIVNSAAPLLTDMLTQLNDVVTKLNEAWTGLDEDQQQAIIKFALVAAAVGPVVSVGGKLVSGIGSLVSAGSGLISGIGSVAGKFSSLASGAGSAVQSVSSLGTAASAAAAPVSSAGSAVGTLSSNALGLVAAGAGIALAAAGMYLLAEGAVKIAESGPGAAAALVLLVAGVAGMAVGAAALAPALTAGAVGLVAFGAGITLVGAGIFLATSGVALLATQLPNIATYGASAAKALTLIGSSLVVVGTGAIAAAGGMTTLLVPFAGAAVTIGATDLALVGLTATLGLSSVAAVALGVAMKSVSVPVTDIAKKASEAGKSLEDMTTSVDVINTALSGLSSIVKQAGDTVKKIVAADGKTINSTMLDSLNRLNTEVRAQMVTVENSFRASLNNIKSMFANTKLSFNQSIALPHFYMVGSFNAKTGQTPSVGVNWYRKAYDDAYLLNGATIFGAMNGRLLGGGEGHGSEMVVGTDKLMSMIKEASRSSAGYTQNVTINSPTALSPSEVARQTKNANRQMVLALRGK